MSDLTKRELEVLELISFAYNSLEIAQLLFISKHTVLTHRKRLLSKLKSKTSAGLVRKGFEHGYLNL